MNETDLAARVRERAERAGIVVADDLADRMAAYLELLRRWNRRMNLTAFDLDAAPDAAIDRLVIESLDAARHVAAIPMRTVDVGSGAGSPAIPLKLARPDLEIVLIEARVKKGAFLREAIRTLALTGAEVFTGTLASYCGAREARRVAGADLVIIRGVRADRALWRDVERLLAPGGRVFWFGGAAATGTIGSPAIPGLARAEAMSGPARILVMSRIIGHKT